VRLQADRVAVSGAHAPLLPATSVSARTGEVTLVAGEPGYGQAALALALALGGRLVPSSGAVRLHGADDRRLLRSGVALVDVPSVTEPEEGLTVRAVIARSLRSRVNRPGPQTSADSCRPRTAGATAAFAGSSSRAGCGPSGWQIWRHVAGLSTSWSWPAPTGSEGTPATGGTSRRNWLAGVRASSSSAPTRPPGCCPNPCATNWG